MVRPVPMTIRGRYRPTFYTDSLGWTEPDALVEIGDGVAADRRYLVIVGVGDFVNMSPDHSSFPLLDDVSDATLADIRAGRALLVLDQSNEGPNMNRTIFDGFHRGMAERCVPLTSIMLITQNRLLARSYHEIYGHTGLAFGIHDFFVKLIIASFDANSAGRFATEREVAEYELGDDPAARDFLCMNATPRWHRVLLYRYLTLQGHAARGLVSFHGANPSNPKISSLDQVYYTPAVARDFGELIIGIDEWMPREPVRFDDGRRMGNELAQSLESWAYQASLYSIVTESDFFDEDRLERITEKMVKAAALGHPFIVVGNPRSIRFMAELGFDTFEGVIDHRYDLVSDPTERMRMIFREIDRQQGWLAHDRRGWIDATRAGAYHNMVHARAGLRQRYARLVERPLLQRFGRFIDTGALDYPLHDRREPPR